MKTIYCSWCGNLHIPSTPGSLAVGGSFSSEYNFCSSCAPMIKDCVAEYGPGFFPAGYEVMEELYDAGELFKNQKGGD